MHNYCIKWAYFFKLDVLGIMRFNSCDLLSDFYRQ